jgi:3-hydroxyacyl-[acyl-carrier-protein] dehydratase
MILKDELFTVKKQNITAGKVGKADFRIKWNVESFIYRAHFPGNPVTPGVCLIQTVVELFGLSQGADFGIKTLKNVKFTAPVNPLDSDETDFSIEFSENETLWQIKAIVKENDVVFAKMSMILK